MANFIAIADIAAGLPFLKAILLKKSDKCVSLRLPIAFTDCRSPIFNLLLPLSVIA